MTEDVGIVGDIHGDLGAVEALINRALNYTDTVVFVGDYINRGPYSAQVIDFLISLGHMNESIEFLAGNHEREFLEYIDGASSERLISIGGAATLRSYLGTASVHDHLDYRELIPQSHVRFLRELRDHYSIESLVVTHSPHIPLPAYLNDLYRDLYHVAGHIPQRSLFPYISETQALIDTGCGTWPDGRLTCLFWPSRDWFQVDSTSSCLVY